MIVTGGKVAGASHHSHPSSAEAKFACSPTFFPPDALVTLCLVKHRGKFFCTVYRFSASTYFRYYIRPNFDTTNLSLCSDVSGVVTYRFQRPAKVVERMSFVQNGAKFA